MLVGDWHYCKAESVEMQSVYLSSDAALNSQFNLRRTATWRLACEGAGKQAFHKVPLSALDFGAAPVLQVRLTQKKRKFHYLCAHFLHGTSYFLRLLEPHAKRKTNLVLESPQLTLTVHTFKCLSHSYLT